MAETTQGRQGRRKEVIGKVVSNKMKKTIVVEVTRKKSHPLYGRVVRTARSSTRTMRRTRRTSATWFALKRPARCRS